VKIGTLVLYHYSENEFAPNHTTPVPAIIVRVHSDDLVNLRLFADSLPQGAEYRPHVPAKALRTDTGHYFTPLENDYAEG
jgi:hypothetical protein